MLNSWAIIPPSHQKKVRWGLATRATAATQAAVLPQTVRLRCLCLLYGGSMGGPQGSAGSRKRFPVRQPVESPPPFGDGCGGFCKPNRLEAIMAQIYSHPNAASGVVQQHRQPGRRPRHIVNLQRFRSDKEFYERCGKKVNAVPVAPPPRQPNLQTKIELQQSDIDLLEGILLGYRHSLQCLKQQLPRLCK
jgi:hypothetical protein